MQSTLCFVRVRILTFRLSMRVVRHPLKRFYGQRMRLRHQSALAGYVVMPEHAHLLIGESAKDYPSKVLQVLKQKVSRTLHAKKHPRPARCGYHSLSNKPKFALSGSGAFTTSMWSEKKMREELVYMHRNPVQHFAI